jgi:hypothetical protein
MRAMTVVMISTMRDRTAPPVLSSAAEFRGWLARTGSCPWFEYHRGLLVLDRSPESKLSDADRRALAKIADAVFQAAEQGQVHLVQRRRGPFDFSYLAIKSVRAATRRTVAHSPLCSEAA